MQSAATHRGNSMNSEWFRFSVGLAFGLLFNLCSFWDAAAESPTNAIQIEGLEGSAELLTPGATRWISTARGQLLYPSDQLRVATNSRVTLRWSDQGVLRLDALTQVEIL